MVFIEKLFLKDDTGSWSEQQSINTETVLSQSTKKDLSLIAMKDWNLQKNEKNGGFCHQRFRPNIIISRYHMVLGKPGTHFEIGNAGLFVVKKKNRCHEACPRFQENGEVCGWKSRVLYAEVICNGRIRKGDPIHLFIDQLSGNVYNDK